MRSQVFGARRAGRVNLLWYRPAPLGASLGSLLYQNSPDLQDHRSALAQSRRGKFTRPPAGHVTGNLIGHSQKLWNLLDQLAQGWAFICQVPPACGDRSKCLGLDPVEDARDRRPPQAAPLRNGLDRLFDRRSAFAQPVHGNGDRESLIKARRAFRTPTPGFDRREARNLISTEKRHHAPMNADQAFMTGRRCSSWSVRW